MAITSLDASSPLYAVIDLGSNSFHMLITRQLANSVQIVDKVKRKVRLASGLDKNNLLSEKAIARGLECLNFFAERLQDIPSENIRIVATATLRLATNRNEFLHSAQNLLGYPVNLLSGQQEAEYIYQGVAHTCCSEGHRLVIDIGGASTELVVGNKYQAKAVTSIDMGCVTYKQQYFINGVLNTEHFSQAINAAKKELTPFAEPYKKIGWEVALSGSGTMQALTEILTYRHLPIRVTLDFLAELKTQILAFDNINDIKIAGLEQERVPVLASGLAIFIAIFESFEIYELQLSEGALREGLLYEMLQTSTDIGTRERTINSLSQRFHIDKSHAERVKKQALSILGAFKNSCAIQHPDAENLLAASCHLHEVGLLLSFKKHQEHGAYIIQNVELPGFNRAEKQLLAALILQYKENLKIELLKEQTALPAQEAFYLLMALRIAVILCRRRKDEVLPSCNIRIDGLNIYLSLPDNWANAHPLIIDELHQENTHLAQKGFSLTLSSLQNL